MYTAISIVGAFAILFSILHPVVCWGEAHDRRSLALYLAAVISTLGELCAIALFVLALTVQSVIAISLVGGFAVLGGLTGTIECWRLATREAHGDAGFYWFAASVTLGLFLNAALLVLALVK